MTLGRRSQHDVRTRHRRMRGMDLESMTREEVADRLGVSERTVRRDEMALGRRCRVRSAAEISEMGVAARRRNQARPSRQEMEMESAGLMARWLRMPIAVAAA